MSSIAESFSTIKITKPLLAISGVLAVLLICVALALPSLHRSAALDPQAETASVSLKEFSSSPDIRAGALAHQATVVETALQPQSPVVDGGRKVIRTSSIEMVVRRPAETVDRINALAESMGGYVVASENGGANATVATMTVRIPAARFEEAREQLRGLGVRVENEKVATEDVTRRYVDQDANIRNLRAEEAQYLAILKQATSVKDLMAVSEKLSEVRGEIEQQEAEFNALVKQVDTVAIAISLRTEPETQVLGLNWRPGYRLQIALHDGLESLANYASAMTAILSFLPAAILWVATILTAGIVSWRLMRWAGRRWFDAKETTPVAP